MNFEFKSSDHLRYENGVHVSGPHGGARRLVKVEPNISGSEGFSVSMYNLDGNHPVWQNNIQMAHKQMKVIEESENKTVLETFRKAGCFKTRKPKEKKILLKWNSNSQPI
jgi:hypothetical protein